MFLEGYLGLKTLSRVNGGLAGARSEQERTEKIDSWQFLMIILNNGKTRYITVNYATAAAPSTKGQLESTHYRGHNEGQQAEKSQQGKSIRYLFQRYII